jgi:O-antigen ligase
MPTPAAGGRSYLLLLTGAWTMAGIVLYLLAPRVAPNLLPLCVLAPALWRWRLGGSMAWRTAFHRPSAVTILLALAGVYLLINGTWSLSPSAAYAEIACYFLIIASLSATIGLLRQTPLPVLRAMAVGFFLAVLLASALLCFEAFSQQAAHGLLISYVPELSPAPHHMHVQGDAVGSLEPHLLNFSMTALALLFWPAALALSRLEVSRGRQAASLFGLALAAAAIFRSEHATSKIAFLGAAAGYAAWWVAPKLARRSALIGWIAMTLLVAPLATLAYTNELYLASWLPGSARQRIVIWGYTSGQIAKAPLLGAGVSTARALHNRDDAPRAPGSKYRLTTGWHSHNGYLQAWYETGAVGVLFVLGLGVLVLRSLAIAEAGVQPYLYATFISCAVVAGSSFSLWAPWFMASLALAAVFAVLGSELGHRQPGGAAPRRPPQDPTAQARAAGAGPGFYAARPR